MAHLIFKHMINTLESILVSVENDIDLYDEYFNDWPKKPENASGKKSKVFSRKTKLTLRVMFWLIVSRIVHSLPVALDGFFTGLELPTPTKSAFSMKRTLIKSDFFQFMGRSLVEAFYKSDGLKKWRGYVLLACDGSRLSLPDIEDLGNIFGWCRSNRSEILYPSAKACVFQDTLNNITVYANIVSKSIDERESFEEYFEQALGLVGQKAIMLLDRGYFSYLAVYLMIKRGIKFVMKVPKLPWRDDFIKSGRKQQTVRVVPTKTTSIYNDSDWQKEPDKELSLRLVRFDHPDGTVDVLATNLTSAEGVTAADIIDLYRLRWPVETAYGIYKNEEALELFSSFREEGVRQDFNAAVILFNLASMLAMDATGKIKVTQKPDMNVIIGLLHNFCPLLVKGLQSPSVRHRLRFIELEVAYYTVEIKTERSFPRIRRKRKLNGKFHRQTNYALAL